MNKKERIRTKTRSLNSISWQATVYNGDNQAVQQGLIIPTYIPGIENRYMRDFKNLGRKVLQDCTNSSHVGDYFPLVEPLDNGGVLLATGTGIADHWVVYPKGRLIIDSSVYNDTVLADLRDPEKLFIAESLFRDSALPRSIDIKVDPYDTGFSIWYLVVDLLQMKGLLRQLLRAPTLNRRFRRLDLLDKKFHEPRDRSGELKAHKGVRARGATARQLADDHLMVSFGLLPTVADIQSFLTLLLKWRKVYDNMKEKLASPHSWVQTPVKLTKQYPTELTFNGVSSVGVFSVPIHVQTTARIRTTATWHGMAKYHYDAPEAQGWLARIKQFIDAFGVLDPAAVWDVIPWSFVVDWFYGIGTWLHRNRPQLFPANIMIDDYCESIKVERVVSWYGTYDYVIPILDPRIGNASHVSDFPLGTEYHTNYIRRRCKPPPIVVTAPQLNPSFLTVRRALLSASLLTQRVLR